VSHCAFLFLSRITNSVRQCFQSASTGVLRLPEGLYNTRHKYNRLVMQYYKMEGRVPSLDVLAEDLGLSLQRLELVLRVTRPLLSIDAPLHQSPASPDQAAQSSDKIADTLETSELSPENHVELSFLRQSLENAMATELAPYERDILRLRLGLDDGVSRTIREVAHEFGGALSMAEVRSGEKRAYNKLRSTHTLVTYQLLAYLDIAGVDKSTVTLRS